MRHSLIGVAVGFPSCGAVTHHHRYHPEVDEMPVYDCVLKLTLAGEARSEALL